MVWREEKSRALEFYVRQINASVLNIGQWRFKFSFRDDPVLPAVRNDAAS
jgi:hypothetical protein